MTAAKDVERRCSLLEAAFTSRSESADDFGRSSVSFCWQTRCQQQQTTLGALFLLTPPEHKRLDPAYDQCCPVARVQYAVWSNRTESIPKMSREFDHQSSTTSDLNGKMDHKSQHCSFMKDHMDHGFQHCTSSGGSY